MNIFEIIRDSKPTKKSNWNNTGVIEILLNVYKKFIASGIEHYFFFSYIFCILIFCFSILLYMTLKSQK